MSNNSIPYDNVFTCEGCGVDYVGKFYLLTTTFEEKQVSSCPFCGNRNERNTIKLEHKPVLNAPLPKAEPSTGKIGRSTWGGLPTDLVFVLKFREKLDSFDSHFAEAHLKELEQMSKSNLLRNFPEDIERYNELVKDFKKEEGNG